jgi:hypothetical protein
MRKIILTALGSIVWRWLRRHAPTLVERRYATLPVRVRRR